MLTDSFPDQFALASVAPFLLLIRRSYAIYDYRGHSKFSFINRCYINPPNIPISINLHYYLGEAEKCKLDCATPHDREVVGSNPSGCQAFYLLCPISSASLIQVLH